MILRAEQGPLTSPSPCLLPGGASWLDPAPDASSCREAVWLVLGLGFCTGGEGRGRPSGTLFTSCFFTDEVGEREMGESPSSSPLHNGLRQRLLGHSQWVCAGLVLGEHVLGWSNGGIAVACPRVEFWSPRALVVCFCVVMALARELEA